MATPVIMPKFEMAQETGTVLRWLKEEQSSVDKGEAIIEIETDKVTMEVEAPASGILVGVQAQAGEIVPIGQPIAHIIAPDEAWHETPEETETRTVTSEDTSSVKATPVAERIARTHEIDLHTVAGTGPGGRITKEDVETYLAQQQTASPSAEKVRAVPAARRLAREMNVDLVTVAGTGPDGRIQSADVRRTTDEVAVSRGRLEGRPTVRRAVPLTGMRRTIAERMAASSREAPQFTISTDVHMARAMDIVEDLRHAFEAPDGPRVTLTTLLVKACAWALRRHPAVNAALEDDQIVEWEDVNIGVAVAVEDGLIVPVIHGVDTLSIQEIAIRLTDLPTRARVGELRPADVQGGTFTLSNLGMFRVDRFTAILNPPEAAILAVGRVTKRPHVTEDDRVEVRQMASLTLTADHRVLDGAIAGRFLGDLSLAIERPGVLL